MRDSCVCDAAFCGKLLLIFVGASGHDPSSPGTTPPLFWAVAG